MKRFFTVISALMTLSLVACGGSSNSGSSNSTGPSVSAALKVDTPFKPGDAVPFTVSTSNFKLVPPLSMRMSTAAKHNGEDHGEGQGDGNSDEPVVVHGGAGDHDDSGVNPNATEGHYHVYLNDGEGSDPHVTSWSNDGVIQLPSAIARGSHSLRFELRDNNHVKVGAEDVLFFEVQP